MEEHWCELILKFTQEGHAVVLLDNCTGPSHGWPSTLREINRPFGQLACIVSMADLVVSPDSGVYHLAGALKVPALGIFHSTNGAIISSIWKGTGYAVTPNGKSTRHDGCLDPCYGFPQRGRTRKCNSDGCVLAHQIIPDDVFRRGMEILDEHSGIDGGYQRLPAEAVR